MLKRKAQVTLMIIAGVLLLLGLSFFFLSNSSVEEQMVTQTVTTSQTQSAELTPIKEYVQQCLDTVTTDAIDLMTKQGGYLYVNQGGPIMDYQSHRMGRFFVEHDSLRVPYRIYPPKFALDAHFSSVPQYPTLTFPYKNGDYTTTHFDGYFGTSSMPPLLEEDGPSSIQFQLREYALNNLYNCTDFSIFYDDGYLIERALPNVTVDVEAKGVHFSVYYPLEITHEVTGEKYDMAEFVSRHSLRLLDHYAFVSDVIANEISDLSYQLRDSSNNDNGFTISLRNDVFDNDDLVIVRDTQSRIRGKPVEFQFAVHNRAPALFYLSNEQMAIPGQTMITGQMLLPAYATKYDARDPDDDDVSITLHVESQVAHPPLPIELLTPELIVRVEATDGEFTDYQDITITRIDS